MKANSEQKSHYIHATGGMVLKNTLRAGAHRTRTGVVAAMGVGSERRWHLATRGGVAVAARGGGSEAVAARRWQRDAGCSEAVAARGGGCDTVAASGNMCP